MNEEKKFSWYSNFIHRYITADVFSLDKSGINKYLIPSIAPSKVRPRISRMKRRTYGNIDVK
jgi:hypothetical protein